MKKLLVLLLLLGVMGCYYEYPRTQYRKLDMSRLKLGMSEAKVKEILGEPADVIGSKYYEGGHVIRVMEYMEAALGLYIDYKKKDYYLYFLDDELIQWGRPGDWQREADYIYEVRFR
ncbi:MAG: hypothetical protein H8E87_02640 [FCB group bacterium]|nr:hypothetical protein [FCB group bacterium]